MLYSDINVDDPLGTPLLGDVQAVEESLLNILDTRKYERPFNLEVDGEVSDDLFDIINETNASLLYNKLYRIIQSWEQRIQIDKRSGCTPNEDNNGYTLRLYYSVPGYAGGRELFIPFRKSL